MSGLTDLPAEPSPSRVLLPALGEIPGHLMWRSHARVAAALAEVLPEGVDIHAYAALLALAGGVTRSQQEIAQTISISRTTMVRVAADLAGAALVERVRNPEDRRSYALTRTPAGAAAVRRWRRHAQDVEGALTASFGAEEVAELRGLLLAVCAGELSPHTPPDLLGSIGFLLTRVHALMHKQFVELLAPLGIEPRHYGSLVALSTLGPVAQAELARHLGVSAASVVQIVDDMSRRGILERRRLESDRRTQVLHLLPEAVPVLAQAREQAGAMAAHHLAPLGEAGTRRLVELLRRFVTAP